MKIHSTRAKLPGFAAGLVAGTLLLAATGSSHAVPQGAAHGLERNRR
jgi:hypothetical protein